MELIKKGATQYKANLHCHSILSDGKLSPEELKKAYKDHGYSVLAITDHEYPCDHSELTDDEFLMLTGYEAYIRPGIGKCVYDRFGPEVHINLLARDPHNVSYVCYNDYYCKYVKDPKVKEGFKKVGSSEPRRYDVEYVNSFIRDAKENGYICAHNHAYWSMEEFSYLEGYDGFFSMEMCNFGSFLLNGTEYNAHIYDNLSRRGKRIFCHSADDNHNKEPFDSPYSDSFGGFTMIMADELTYPSVFSALEAGNFYSSMGPLFHSITIENGKIHIETDPVRQITVFNGSKTPPHVIGTKDAPITSADFDMPEEYTFLRFGILDFEGKHADTRAYFPDEITK